MNKIIAILAMCLPLPCFAAGTIDVTTDNCRDLFSNEAAEICVALAAQADVFTIKEFGPRVDDPFYVRILTKPDMDGRGVRLESTSWAESADAALFEAADILDKIRRGEW